MTHQAESSPRADTPAGRFLAAAERGRNDWWRYLTGVVLILFTWLILGSVVWFVLSDLYIFYAGSAGAGADPLSPTGNPLVEFLTLHMTFVMMIVGTAAAVRRVHKRPVKTLITPAEQIRWGRIGQGFGLFFAIVTVAALIEALFVNPGIYTPTFSWSDWLPFAAAILIFTPIQITAEELLFRGYILQGLGRLLTHPLALTVLNGLLFMAPHLLNPEVQVNPLLLGLNYFVSGAFFTYVTLQDGGMELALGAHAANNMFALLFANYIDSAVPTPAVFTITELDPVYALISLMVGCLLFTIVFHTYLPADRPA